MIRKMFSIMMACVFLFSLFSFPTFAEESGADTVYINGNIYTVDENNRNVSALAIKGQYLTYVGDDEGVKKLIGVNTKVIDLKGKAVIPGLIEGHMHYPGEGQKLLQIDAFWKPKKDILKAVKAEADRLPDGEWVLGRGWNQEVWEDNNFPTKEELDAVAPNNPVALTRTCGHALWVNSKALEISGITKETPNPKGGEILKDSNQNILGILTDTAKTFVTNKIPPFNETRKKEALMKAQEELFSYGITTSLDAGSGVKDIENMKDLYKTGDLKIRLYVMASAGNDAKEYYKKGPEKGLFDNRLTVNCIKFYADGSLGARSAWMLDEYSDRPGHFGNGRNADDVFYQMVKEAREHGFQVATHAIGDAAVRQCVDTYEKVLKEMPLDDHRYRIEHFQVATLEDIDRIAKIGIIPAMQSVHATSDKNMAEDRVGPERIKGAYAWRKVIKAGSIIVNGSDAPVEQVNPYHGLYAAVTRMDREGNPLGGWYSEECMTREEALKSFTIWAAYGQFEEKIKGSLEVGKLADFVVIDRDYMTCPASDIKDINALTTVVGGEVVYEKPESDNTTVMIKGNIIDFGVQPINQNGRILIPAQNLCNVIGATFTYDDTTKTIIVMKDSTNITLKVGESKLIKNREELLMDISAKKVNGEVFIPLRFIIEEFGYKVMWYGDSKIVSINL